MLLDNTLFMLKHFACTNHRVFVSLKVRNDCYSFYRSLPLLFEYFIIYFLSASLIFTCAYFPWQFIFPSYFNYVANSGRPREPHLFLRVVVVSVIRPVLLSGYSKRPACFVVTDDRRDAWLLQWPACCRVTYATGVLSDDVTRPSLGVTQCNDRLNVQRFTWRTTHKSFARGIK